MTNLLKYIKHQYEYGHDIGQKDIGKFIAEFEQMQAELQKYRQAEAEGRMVVFMPQSEFDSRLEKLRAENWKVNSLCRDCGGVPPHLEDKLFALLKVKKAPTGYIDTCEAALAKEGANND